MRHLTHPVNGSTVDIYVPDTAEDYNTAMAWVSSRPRIALGLDTETTGLETYAPDFYVRTVQVGTGSEAYVLRTGTPHGDAVIRAILTDHPRFIAHNAPYDLLALDRVGLAPLDTLLPKVWDTYILAHLLDPRAQGEEGAVGLSLKALSAVYVDPDAKDSQAALRETFRALGRRISDGWSHPDLPQDDTYLRYAGLDPVYTVRLMEAIGPMVKSMGMTKLTNWEHDIQSVTTRMMHRGVLVDVEYTERLVHDLQEESDRWAAVAARYGVQNVNSTAQVRDALLAMGVELTEKTATGNLSVGKDALLPLAGLTPYWSEIVGADVNPLAEAVVKSKRAAKWKTAYAESFLHLRDENDRIHPGIKSLAARTARMSVSSPPLQQLPAGDWRIRRAMIADEGNVFVSSDFSQIELRVLAANAGVEGMKEAIRTGRDLHDRTAAAIWGDGFTKKQRGIAKSVNFLKIYGGGAAKLAKTAGISPADAREVFDAFDRAYPEVRRYGNKLQRDATQDGWAIRTATGRRLPLSRERSYAATNYCFAPGTRILTADLVHVPVETLSVGDELVGFDEYPVGERRGQVFRKLRRAIVEAVSVVAKPSTRLHLDNGHTVTVSDDHMWLVHRPTENRRFQWVATTDLLPTDSLLSLGMWETDTSRTAGYLAGLLDGEAYMGGRAGGAANTVLTFSQLPGMVMEAYLCGMADLGLPATYRPRSPRSTSPCASATTTGVTNIMRVLGTLQPARLYPRAHEVWEGAAIVRKMFEDVHVVRSEDVGTIDVVAVQTSTSTLIADGMLSHNCIQSTARDLFAKALLDVSRLPGMDSALSLVVHDEILTQVPVDAAPETAQVVADTMAMRYMGVPISAESEVFYGGSWGSGYGIPAESDHIPAQHDLPEVIVQSQF